MRALTPLILFELTQVEFNDLLHRQPGLAYALVSIFSERLEQSENTCTGYYFYPQVIIA